MNNIIDVIELFKIEIMKGPHSGLDNKDCRELTNYSVVTHTSNAQQLEINQTKTKTKTL